MNPDHADHDDDDMPRAVEHALRKHNAMDDELCRTVAGEVWKDMQAAYDGLFEMWRKQAINMRALARERDELREAIEQALDLNSRDQEATNAVLRAALEGKP